MIDTKALLIIVLMLAISACTGVAMVQILVGAKAAVVAHVIRKQVATPLIGMSQEVLPTTWKPGKGVFIPPPPALAPLETLLR